MEQAPITDRFTKAIEQLGKIEGATPNKMRRWTLRAPTWRASSRAPISGGTDRAARRKTGSKREPPHRSGYIDLMKPRLCGARLIDANLQGADLDQADLRGASLH
jgi:hypothetical protein